MTVTDRPTPLAAVKKFEEPVAPPKVRRRMAARRTWRRIITGFIGVLLALTGWEIAAAIINDPITLPNVQDTMQAFWTYMFKKYPAQGDTLWSDILISTWRILMGFSVGTVIGVLLGSVMAAVRVIRELVDPLIELTRPLPPLAFIPLFVVWFGIGETPKFVLILIGVIPVITVATVGALDRVPQDYLNASRALGASHVHTLIFVRVRAALPGIITGMRLAMGLSWTSIVAVEMIAATSGVGFLILQAGNNLQMPLLFAGILTISILGIILDGALRLLHRFADPSTR
jgi:ABC-type nitrate/sulfonate/bicarbonate transport system permease component